MTITGSIFNETAIMIPAVFVIIIVLIIIAAKFIGSGTGISDRGGSAARGAWSDRPYRPRDPRIVAGAEGERFAASEIGAVLRPGDRMFKNVLLFYGDISAECDFIVVNSYGVFVIEVKNYIGDIDGSADDRYWEKTRYNRYGRPSHDSVENPIVQARNHAGVVGKYLRSCGIYVWVEGYGIVLSADSVVRDARLLTDRNGIDRALHTSGKNHLTPAQIDSVCRYLSCYCVNE